MNVDRLLTIGRYFAAAVVLFAVPTGISIVASGHSPAQLAMLFGFTAWGVVWVWLWLRAAGRSRGGEVVGLVGTTALFTMFSLIEPQPSGTFLVFAFVVVGVCFPPRMAVMWSAGILALQAALLVIRQVDPATAVNSLINSIFVVGVGMGARLLWNSYRQLLEARGEIARLAVSEERLRFARDMHDVVGQGLAMIVLKSELASQQLPADAGDSVRQELQEIVGVARKSLNDVREAVGGYRRPTLPAEISSARAALRAAGIDFVVSDQIGTVPPDKDAVLAWCLREAVTNVVKHSGAGRCDLQLSRENGQVSMRVSDDGRGAADLGGGSGIAGMRERAEMAGGTLDVKRDGGVSVVVTVPSA